MRGLVDSEAFNVGKIDSGSTPQRHLLLIEIALKRNELRVGIGFRRLDYGAERIADPRHHDGPSFDAAVAVDPLFERRELQNFVHRVLARLGALALDRNFPRRSHEFRRVLRRIALVGAKLVVIVVRGHDLRSRDLLGGAEGAGGKRGKLRGGVGSRRGADHVGKALASQGQPPRYPQALKEFAAVQVRLARGYVRILQVRGSLDQHCMPPGTGCAALIFLYIYYTPKPRDWMREGHRKGAQCAEWLTFRGRIRLSSRRRERVQTKRSDARNSRK